MASIAPIESMFATASRSADEARMQEIVPLAIDSSPDLIFIVDPAAMRFLYVNETACRVEGCTRTEYLQRTPMEGTTLGRNELERLYREVIAKGEEGMTTEYPVTSHDGRKSWFEAHRRALKIDGRWIIVTIARDMHRRRRAEKAAQRLSRMYAALCATNEVLMRAKSPQELYQQVCDAAVHGGKFITTAVLIPDIDNAAKVSAVTGDQRLREACISVDASTPAGRGIIGIAFRSRKTCVSNDFLNDERTRPWHKQAAKSGVNASAAVPLLRGTKTLGILLFHSGDKRAFDGEVVGLLERMAQNISFALDNFDRDAERRSARMYATLSATNEAILRAKSPEEMFQLVCEAAVSDGRFSHATIVAARPDQSVAVVAGAGRGAEIMRRNRVSPDAALAEGRGLVGAVLRTGKLCVSNDLANDERALGHDTPERTGARAGAVLPIVVEGAVRGALALYASETGAFDDDIVKLFERMARNIAFALANFERETERRNAAERVQYLATHDSLTGLPNRVMFNELLSVAIASAERHQRRVAVLFIDLDRFNVINDTLGHEVGDLLLKEMAARLKQCLRTSDVVARPGGDEFLVLLQEAGDAAQVATVARKIQSALMQPTRLGGQQYGVTASMGIALYPSDGVDEKTLLTNADSAMYRAKEEGKNNFQFYSPDMNTQSLERLTLETHLQGALERNEFRVHYQPKVDLATGRISGVEALLRWQSPIGPVSPVQFIPIAEDTGLIVPIGRWVLKEACAQNVAWQRRGLAPTCVAVNLSARQFSDENLLHDIAQALKDSGLAPHLLELEITEGMVMKNPERAAALLAALKRMGVRLAIDDFGTGYSSLAQLKRFPIDTLKIDRSFIRDVPADPEDAAITEAIIAMGKTLNLTVVAEGVETEAQAQFLREHACDEMQGFYFSKPVAPDDFAALLGTPTAMR